MKNNDHLQSRMGEKRHYFGIRRLKVGVASVVIASGFLLGNAQLVRADEASTATSPATEAASDANAAALPSQQMKKKLERQIVQERELQSRLLQLVC